MTLHGCRAGSAARARWFPLGATRRATAARTSRSRRASPTAMLLCLFDERGRGDPDPAAGPRRRRLARRSCRASAPGRPTATARPGPYDPAAGPALQPGQAAARPVRPGDHRRGPVRAGGARLRRRRPGRAEHARLGRATCRAAWSSTRPSTGATSPAPAPRTPTRSSTRCTSRASPMRHPDVPPELRGTYAGLGHEAAIAHLLDLGVTAVELLPGAPERARGVPARPGPDQLLGLQHDRLLRAARRLLGRGPGRPPGRPGRRVQGDGRRPARAPGWRCCSTWCSTTPPRATTRARRCATAAWTTRPTTGSTRTTRAATSTRPAAATRSNAGDPLALQLIMDSLRYWLTEMHVDGFRFDLAPTLARQDGGFDRVVGVLRPGVAGPGGVAGQADRRAVGRRPGRQLRRRPVPAAVAGVERQVPRHHARLLAQPRRSARRVRHPLRRLVGPVRRRRAAPDRVGQPDHRARRLHPAPTWSPTTTSTTRPTARTTGTAPTTTARGTAASRAPPTTRTILALRGRQRRAMLTTLLLSFGVPMLLGGDELGRTQQGNNNAYCQDNEITWFDWSARRRRAARRSPGS